MTNLTDINVTTLVTHHVRQYVSTLHQFYFTQLKSFIVAHEPILNVVDAIEAELTSIVLEQKRHHTEVLEDKFLKQQAKDDREESLKDEREVLEDAKLSIALREEMRNILDQHPRHTHSTNHQHKSISLPEWLRLNEINLKLNESLPKRESARLARKQAREDRFYKQSIKERLSHQNYQAFIQKRRKQDAEVDELKNKKFTEAKNLIFPVFLIELRQTVLQFVNLTDDEKQAIIELINVMTEFLSAEQETLKVSKALQKLQETIERTELSITTTHQRIKDIATELQLAPEKNVTLNQKNKTLDNTNKTLALPAWITLGISVSLLLVSGGLYFSAAALGVALVIPSLSLVIPLIVASACLIVSLGLFAAKGINRLQKHFNNKKLHDLEAHVKSLNEENETLTRDTIPTLTQTHNRDRQTELNLRYDLNIKSQACEDLLQRARAIYPPSAPPVPYSVYEGSNILSAPPPYYSDPSSTTSLGMSPSPSAPPAPDECSVYAGGFTLFAPPPPYSEPSPTKSHDMSPPFH
ncbi:hypothetical protein [Legionella yabuuchiae]|uniref:hypothetical protein n=1 Tax=Legionella yabuuchiae TaxID=376727 RepID=UPI0010552B33|nr:hypothetical protein [Legionella yabuuchiae]